MLTMERDWAQLGKLLLLLWGIACLVSSHYQGPGEFSLVVKLWVGGLGALNLIVGLSALVRR